MDNKTKILIAFPVILVIILIFAAGYVPFSKDFSVAEEQILEFITSDLKIKEVKRLLVSGGTNSPIDFKQSQIVKKSVSKGNTAPQEDHIENNVSLIIISGKRKMAIIDGRLLMEGDQIDGALIAAIEPGRVLLKNKISQWVYMDE